MGLQKHMPPFTPAIVWGIILPMAYDFQIPDVLRGLGNPLQVHPPRAVAGRTGYFIVPAVLLIVSGLP
jgi:hypothetical protein